VSSTECLFIVLSSFTMCSCIVAEQDFIVVHDTCAAASSRLHLSSASSIVCRLSRLESAIGVEGNFVLSLVSYPNLVGVFACVVLLEKHETT